MKFQLRLTSAVWAVATFVVLACASVLGISLWLAHEARDVQMREAVLTTKNLSRAVAKHVNGSIAEVDHMLAALVEGIERADLDSERLERLQPILVGHASRMPQLRGIFIYDASGNWVVNSESTPERSGNNSDREYFIFHRSHSSEALHVGRPILSRTSYRWVIPLSRRLSSPSGDFAGVVLATVDIEYLTKYLAQFDVNAKGALLLALKDGDVLDRRPYTDASLQTNIHDLGIFAGLAENHDGTSFMVSPFDKVERIVSYERFDDYGIYAFAALSQDEVLADWRHATLLQFILISGLCLAFVSIGSYVVVLINRRSRSEHRLRQLRDELTAANALLELTSRLDALTGLSNRRDFDEMLAKEAQVSERRGSSLAIVMIDIDQFKQFNDHYGHQGGDDCLKAVASAVRSASQRPGDVVARYGGEEIVMLLPQTDTAGAAIVAQRVQAAVRGLAIAHQASRLGHVSVSIGVSSGVVGHRAATAVRILADADMALYRAKETGRNRTCVAEADREACVQPA